MTPLTDNERAWADIDYESWLEEKGRKREDLSGWEAATVSAWYTALELGQQMERLRNKRSKV